MQRNDNERGRQWEGVSRRDVERPCSGECGRDSVARAALQTTPATHAVRQTIAITTTAVTIHSRTQQQSGARLQPPQLTLQLQ
jgi:hypothetical protein